MTVETPRHARHAMAIAAAMISNPAMGLVPSLKTTSLHSRRQIHVVRYPLQSTLDKSENTKTDADPFFMDVTEKEWAVKNPKISTDSFQRARLAEQLRLSSSTSSSPTTKLFGTNNEILPSSFLSNLATNFLSPILNAEIEKDVPPNIILGSALSGSFATLVTLWLFLSVPLSQTLISAFFIGIIAAYISITQGTTGDTMRQLGQYTMTALQTGQDAYKEFQAGRKIERVSKAMDTLSKINSDEMTSSMVILEKADRAVKEVKRAEAEFEVKQRELEEAAKRKKRALVEAGEVIDFVERAKENLVGDGVVEVKEEEAVAISPEEEEKLWLEEQNRLANERFIARKQQEEAETVHKITVDYNAAAKLAYESSAKTTDFDEFLSEYLASTSAMMAQKHQDRENAKMEEQLRLEREEEEKRIAEELEREEEMKVLELFDAQESEMLELAMEEEAAQPIEDVDMAVKADAERIMREEEVANLLMNQVASLTQEQELNDDNAEDELDEDDWEASVNIANQLAGLDEDEFDQDIMTKGDEIDDLLKVELGDLTQDEEELLGKAAREAVRKYEEEMKMKQSNKDAVQASWEDEEVESSWIDDNEEEEEEDQVVDDTDYSQMTVVQLKEILRSKGLKVGGKKSELIERLMSS